MKNKTIQVIVSIAIILVSVLIVFSFLNNKENKALSPEEVALAFSSNWFTYDGDPLEDRIYQNNSFLSPALINKLNFLDASEAVLCNLDVPKNIEFVDVGIQDELAIVNLNYIYEDFDQLVTFMLVKELDVWKIDEIACEDSDIGSSNFIETGNIVSDEDDWNIVYEKPGAPALVKSLIFNSDSVCLDSNNLSLDCSLSPWENGDRVEVKGILVDDGVQVISLNLINQTSNLLDYDIDTCEERGGVIMLPDCVDCQSYCSFD